MPGAGIRLEDVTVVFNPGTPNEVAALKDINLEIAPGEVVVTLGGNGSGKSTLLKVIAGIIRPTQGRIYIDEQNVTDVKDYQRMRDISFVHQDPLMGTCPNLTLFENMVLSGKRRWWWPVPYHLSLPPKQAAALKSTGLGLHERQAIPLTSFSGGQRQAIATAIVLSKESRLVLLDEFTSSLDEATSVTILDKALQEQVRTGSTLLMVMHDIQRALGLRKRAVFLDKGRLSQDLFTK